MTNKLQTSESTVVIGALARNCDEALRRNIPLVEKMGEAFKAYTVIVYENDSIDDTKEILKQWKMQNEHVVVITEDTHTATVPQQSKQVPFPSMSIARIEKMARFRNRILSEVHRIKPDIYITLDIDVGCFDPATVAEAIDNAPANWGGLFGNAIVYKVYSDNVTKDPRSFDTYAFVEDHVDPVANSPFLLNENKCHFVYGMRLTSRCNKVSYNPCGSAFNFIGIYRYAAIEGSDYSVCTPPPTEPYSVALCEHIPFNLAIRRKGYGNYLVRNLKMLDYHHQKDYKGMGKWKEKHETLHQVLKNFPSFATLPIYALRYKLGLYPYKRLHS